MDKKYERINLGKFKGTSMLASLGASVVPTNGAEIVAHKTAGCDDVVYSHQKIKCRMGDGQGIEHAAAYNVDREAMASLIANQNINWFRSSIRGKFVTDDLRRMIAGVEESNAFFEAFVLPASMAGRFDRTAFAGFPVKFSHYVPDNFMLGGCWSDMILYVGRFCEVEDNVAEVPVAFGPRHGSAFVKMEMECVK